jgi:hypothetical protein
MPYAVALDARHVVPSVLPPARGPLTEALFDLLIREVGRPRLALPRVEDGEDDPLLGDDSALALYALYALHYRGFHEVDPDWEWQPDLLAWRRELERAVVDRLHDEVGPLTPRPKIPEALQSLVKRWDVPNLSCFLLTCGTTEQFRETAQHRSVSHEMLQNLFGLTIADTTLDTSYDAQLSLLPGWTLAGANALSLFGLHRRWLGAAVGYLAAVELASSDPSGGGQRVDADKLTRELVVQRPDLAHDVLFGGATAMALDAEAARRTIDAWESGRSSLLQGASPT